MASKSSRTNKPAARSSSGRRTASSARPYVSTGAIITIFVLAALLLLSVYLTRQKEATAAAATPTPGTTLIFDASYGQPTSIEIKTDANKSTKVVQNADKTWAMELPEKAEASQGTVEEAVTQLTALKVLNDVNGDPSIFGLDNPTHIITVVFGDGKQHVLEIGDATPTNSGYYVRLDQGKIQIVDLSSIDALDNLVLFPPYLNTPTPTALPATATPIPASSTEATVTPTP